MPAQKGIKKPRTPYNKEWIIREISSQSGFSLHDVRIFWQTFEEIFLWLLESHLELDLKNLFKLYYAGVRSRKLTKFVGGTNVTDRVPLITPNRVTPKLRLSKDARMKYNKPFPEELDQFKKYEEKEI
jgi:hypothetical protein